MIEALNPKKNGAPEILFAGNNLSGEYLEHVIEKIGDRDFSVNVVSKSGATLETAVAFRVFSELLVKKYGGGAAARVIVTAGAGPSRPRRFAEESGCALFDIPDDVGGRYSALTAAGLLPAAVAGCDIDAIMDGARDELTSGGASAFRYAAARQSLYRAGYRTEALACFEPALSRFGAWWKQLFGESEGKNGQGVFPVTLDYTTDLHAMGQYMQEGARDVFETVLSLTARRGAVRVPEPVLFDDGIAGITGRSVDALNVLADDAEHTVDKDVCDVVIRGMEPADETLQKLVAVKPKLGRLNKPDLVRQVVPEPRALFDAHDVPVLRGERTVYKLNKLLCLAGTLEPHDDLNHNDNTPFGFFNSNSFCRPVQP
jgi:glucose-6-phosphate isomerase